MRNKFYLLFLMVMLLFSSTQTVLAEESDKSFYFDLTAEGEKEVVVQTGDIITVVLKLKRTDSDDVYNMYAMQDEIRYDSNFLKLVQGSIMLGEDIVTTDIAMVDQYREFYMNYLSMSGGDSWNAEELIGSVQFKVIGKLGVTKITNQDYLVSLKDGSGTYECKADDVFIILSTECSVEFMENGGTDVEDQVVQFGEKIIRPQNPTRKGYELEGWYKDIHLREKWDFDEDIVQSNMTLYAKWVEVENSDNSCWLWILLLLLIIIIIIWKKTKKDQYN